MTSRHLLRAYRATDELTRAAGHQWYPHAFREAARLAALAGCSVERAAGVIAALSPRAFWGLNLVWAARVLDASAAGLQGPPLVSTRANRATAWSIATGAADLEALGPKTAVFARAILGDMTAVTVDVWAKRAALGDMTADATVTEQDRTEMTAAYRRAARILEITPRDLQAVVWLAVRGLKPSDPPILQASLFDLDSLETMSVGPNDPWRADR